MTLTKEELQNLLVLIEIGAKSLSQDKSLRESLQIQNTAVLLMDKLTVMTSNDSDSIETEQ